ncbi:hypothetical protein BDW22DRAFT_1430660 [Trametopsis cervina]|nr:hypothetical protein BDW22DRAFT_1430660 [Trametopsis cervina]
MHTDHHTSVGFTAAEAHTGIFIYGGPEAVHGYAPYSHASPEHFAHMESKPHILNPSRSTLKSQESVVHFPGNGGQNKYKYTPYSSLAGALGPDQNFNTELERVPQATYASQSPLHQPPKGISFASSKDQGISVAAALNNECPPGWQAMRPGPLSQTSTKITCRINWPGYPQFHQPMDVKDHTQARGPLSYAQLAKNIAKAVRNMVTQFKNMNQSLPGRERWTLHDVSLSDIFIAEFHQVSPGSWQPILLLKRRNVS